MKNNDSIGKFPIIHKKELDCDKCKHYEHRPNILGGVTECMLNGKTLNSFWSNEPCDKFSANN